MPRILVPVDYSARSRDTLRCASALARGTGSEITVLHAWDCPPFARKTRLTTASGENSSLDQLLLEAATRELEEFVASAEVDLASKPELVLSPLTPVRAIVDALGSGDHELVVMGTHGRGAVKALVLGSVAQRIVELSPIPVVLVPDAEARSRALREVDR